MQLLFANGLVYSSYPPIVKLAAPMCTLLKRWERLASSLKGAKIANQIGDLLRPAVVSLKNPVRSAPGMQVTQSLPALFRRRSHANTHKSHLHEGPCLNKIKSIAHRVLAR